VVNVGIVIDWVKIQTTNINTSVHEGSSEKPSPPATRISEKEYSSYISFSVRATVSRCRPRSNPTRQPSGRSEPFLKRTDCDLHDRTCPDRSLQPCRNTGPRRSASAPAAAATVSARPRRPPSPPLVFRSQIESAFRSLATGEAGFSKP
jgi:hypothetical protein